MLQSLSIMKIWFCSGFVLTDGVSAVESIIFLNVTHESLHGDRCVSLQDFAHHFHVLLPAGFHATQAAIRQFLQNSDLESSGYQVGRNMVTDASVFTLMITIDWIMALTAFCVPAGVFAGAAASEAAGRASSGGVEENRVFAEALQDAAGEKTLLPSETSRPRHSGICSK